MQNRIPHNCEGSNSCAENCYFACVEELTINSLSKFRYLDKGSYVYFYSLVL